MKTWSWLCNYWLEILIVVGSAVSLRSVFWMKAFSNGFPSNAESAGQLGDFVGGYIGTLMTIGSILLLLLTLKEQRRSWEIEIFESKFFDLLKLHRENVAEMELGGTKGRKVFVMMVRELRSIREVLKPLWTEKHPEYSADQFMEIAYCCLFFGTGPNSSRLLKAALRSFDQSLIDSVIATLDDDETKKRIREDRRFEYTPFEGHQSRLGHYYRHLFQTVAYVNKQKLEIKKYEYVKTLRAQLSTHEQALLLINSRCRQGAKWWKQDFIKEYRMVKNIPQEFFLEDELNLKTLFKAGYFEWEPGSD